MTDITAFLSLLQAGGNLAMIGLFFLMWKFDRRLIKIETLIAERRGAARGTDKIP